MTANEPNQTEQIKIGADGFGHKLLQGVHHMEVEMIRVLHGDFGHASVRDGGPKATHLQVIGAVPDSTVEVAFHSSHPVAKVTPPPPTPTIEPEPETVPETVSDKGPTVDQLVDQNNRDELVTLAEAKDIEVKSDDTKADIAAKLVPSEDDD